MKKVSLSFFIIAGVFCTLLLIANLLWGYKESFIRLNAIRLPFFDNFFLWLTEFGNGFYITIFALLLACTDKKYWKIALNIIACVILTTLIVQICKQVLFPHWHRPAKLLQDKPIYILLNPVPHHNSFPSGHSISVMSTATVLSYVFQRYIFQILLAVFACAVAYTRIYVGAHFPADVAVGSVLGLISGSAVVYLFRNISLSGLQKKRYAKFILYGVTFLCLGIALVQSIL